MFTKALVPLDGSELAEGILPYVSQLSRNLDMPLVLLSVIDPGAVEVPKRMRRTGANLKMEFFSTGGMAAATTTRGPETVAEPHDTHSHETGGPYASQIFENVRIRVKQRLEGVVKELADKGVTAEPVVTFGRTADGIANAAKDHGCDLVAMSTHGRTALGRGILGSITDKVIHSIEIPTLTITPERAKTYWQESEGISRILVPLDGSLIAERSLPYVETIAKALSLKVVLVRVAKIGGMYSAYADGYPYAGYADLEEEIEKEATDYLSHAADRLRRSGLAVEWKLLRGNAVGAIVDLAHKTAQDLIVLTTHGRSGLNRWIMGSVAEGLVRASGDPVLVIPPDR